jgi:enoyl-CoA hydratase/carnithine racemase
MSALRTRSRVFAKSTFFTFASNILFEVLIALKRNWWPSNSPLMLNAVVGSFGTYLALTGRRVSGEEAISLGLATHFVHSSRIPVSCNLMHRQFHTSVAFTRHQALHHRLSELLIPTAAAVDSLLNDFSSIPVPTPEFLKEQEAVADVFGCSSIEELRQRLSRHPHQSWVSSTTKMLDKASPTSLAVTLEQMRRASRLSVRACFEMEYESHFSLFPSCLIPLLLSTSAIPSHVGSCEIPFRF